MGNCVSLSIPLDNSVNKVSQWLEKIGGYTHNLEKNLMALETTMVDLKAKRDDLSRKLKRQEDRGLQRLAKFQVWLNRVETIENRVDDILSARDVELQRLCLCGFCSKSLLSSYSYGKSVFLTLRKVEKLESEVFNVVADQALTPEVEERQIQSIIVGQETMLEKAWKHLMEDGVGIMGMYGMGGVGKTTLLSQIHNKFSKKKCGFDFVIWVVVSQELHVEKILDEIAQQVGLGGEEWEQKDKSQKGVHLYNFLKKKRFVLFLDDIWEKVDLAEIGVPDPRTQKRCKVAFTTRSQEVCSRMGVQVPMEVQCLAEHDAFDLFEKMVGQITLRSDPGIPDLARKVAKECCGLPLALNVIGETMSCKRTIEEWRHAIHVLSLYAAEFSDMEDKILRLLKYSYDSLNGEELKSCLLYCALYPEDYKIPKEELIEYWIGEGIIDGSKGIEIAHNKGYDVIGSLVRASLLMDGVNEDGEAYVRMHDVVREMALWIASDLGKQKEAFIVRAGVGLDGMPKVENWKVVGKMSLMNNKIDHLAGSPECLELTTLLLQRNETLVNISGEFFRSMPKLVVLDLSSNEILSELPDGISEMVSLKYLNLSRTNIECLPVGLQELKNLIQLDLEWTRRLSSIVGVSALLSLKVLKLRGSEVGRNLNTVEELLGLEHLEILTIHISCDSGLDQFLSSQKLLYCTQALWINGTKLESSDIWRLATMEKVRDLILSTCSFAETKMDITSIRSEMLSPLQNPTNACFLSLSKISLLSSNCCKELTWLMFAPNLTVLSIFGAEEVEEIINKEKALVGEESGILPFQKLQLLRLNYLPELKNIYWRYLPFPCLTRIELFNCLKLRKLPLNSKSGSSGLVITCKDRGWFEGVEWEDEATKDRFLSSAIQY